MFHAVCNFI
uniref:Uncharacterized protein n=1 Tax=Arundo donax TaxID=35708 RepID=A0A0A8YGR8_ARUDO